MKIFLVIFILLSLSAQAASEGHGAAGHVSDLLYPAINFAILMTLFFWKVFPAIKDGFKKNHKQISELFNLAEIKEAEAQAALTSIEHKLTNLEKESSVIYNASANEAKVFETNYQEETNHRINRSKEECSKRIEGEKNDALSNIMGELLDEIVVGAKKTVSGDAGKKKKVLESFTSKL